MERASIGDRVVEFWVGLPWFDHGPFSFHYIPRHTLVAFQAMPIVQTDPPYVIPSLGGMAIWASTPAFFYAFFAGTKGKRVWTFGWLLIAVTTGIIISKAIAKAWDLDWGTYEFPYQWNLIPFYILIGMAIWTGRHDKMILACWAAILPVATVPLLIDRLSEVLAGAAANITFVDDSDDETPAIIEEHGQASHLDVRVLHRMGNQRRGGLSTAVVAGIASARRTGSMSASSTRTCSIRRSSSSHC